ncbi:hypothetical protein [Streptomyces sp. NPDC001717]|uniref:hypothetical protein n=1 Tax=Streptomyces sp. NPDC001717 TaxID=3364604 RepID=UPI0036AB52C4
MISRKQHALASLLGIGIVLSVTGTAHAAPKPDLPVPEVGAIKALAGNKGHLVEGQLDNLVFSARCLAAIREKGESLGLPGAVANVLQPLTALLVPSDCAPADWDEIPEYKVTAL